MARRTGARALRLLPDLVIVAGVIGVAAWSRLQMLPFVTVSPDSVDPLLKAYQMLHGGSWLPAGHGAQFGPALYWLHLPYVVDVYSLREAFGRMLAGQAATALIVLLALRVALAPSGRRAGAESRWPARLGALVAAGVIACAHGPRPALAHTYETYQAPLLAALIGAATLWALVGRRPRWFVVSVALIPLAATVHPMALCLAPGVLLLAAPVVRPHGVRSLGLALLVGSLFAIPGLIQVGRVVSGPGDGLATLGAVALSASGEGSQGLARAVWSTFVRPELPPLGPILLLAPLGALGVALLRQRRTRDRRDGALAWFAAWAVLAQLALLGTALVIGYLQPYHLRILLPLAAMQVGVLVTRLAALAWRWASAATAAEPGPVLRGLAGLGVAGALVALLGLAAGFSAGRWSERLPHPDDLHVHERLADSISKDAGMSTRWMEIVSLGGPRSAWGYGPGLALQQLVCSALPEWFSSTGRLYLVVHGPEAERELVADLAGRFHSHPRPLAGGDEAPARLLLRFDEPGTARAFTAELCRILPAARARDDTRKYLHVPGDEAEGSAPDDWFDPCLFGK